MDTGRKIIIIVNTALDTGHYSLHMPRIQNTVSMCDFYRHKFVFAVDQKGANNEGGSSLKTESSNGGGLGVGEEVGGVLGAGGGGLGRLGVNTELVL